MAEPQTPGKNNPLQSLERLGDKLRNNGARAATIPFFGALTGVPLLELEPYLPKSEIPFVSHMAHIDIEACGALFLATLAFCTVRQALRDTKKV